MEDVNSPPSDEERLWAMLSHLLTFVAAFLAPLVIYLVYKDRSRFVAFHALQSLIFQVVVFVLSVIGVILIATVVLACVAGPALVLLGLAMVVAVLVASIKSYQGERWKYPLVGSWAQGMSGA